MEEGYYYLQHPSEEEPTLVYGYYCRDVGGRFVFGFNTYDGGGFLPLDDLTIETKVTRVTITPEE